MKLSKAFLLCLGFCWTSFLLDVYAAWQTGYWSMLAATGGVRLFMTAIGLAWHIPGKPAQGSSLESQPEFTPCPAYGGMLQEPFLACTAPRFQDALGKVSAPVNTASNEAESAEASSFDRNDGQISEDYQTA